MRTTKPPAFPTALKNGAPCGLAGGERPRASRSNRCFSDGRVFEFGRRFKLRGGLKMSDEREKGALQTSEKWSRRKLMQGVAAVAGGTAAAALLPVATTVAPEAHAAAAPAMSENTISASSKRNI